MWLLLACTGTPEDTAAPVDPFEWSVADAGPYNVGFATWEHSYRPTGWDEDRTIAISLWYPTEDVDGKAALYYGSFEDDTVFADAEPLATAVHAEGFPVHVYSHGYSGYGAASPFLMKHFASHGWVVVAPDHTGNTIGEHTDDLPAWFRWVRAEDVSAALDAIQDRGDTSRVVLSGHSFGGYTTWATSGGVFDADYVESCEDCTEADKERMLAGLGDERVVAALPLAGSGGSWLGIEGHDAVEIPVLMMSGTEDAGHDPTDVWEQTTTVDLRWANFLGGCHQLWALGQCNDFDTDEGFDAVNTYSLAFARQVVLEDSTAEVTSVLDGTTEVHPDVEYLTR